jgi:transposase
VAKQRIAESAAGFRELLELLAVHGQSSDEPLPIAIETAKGLLPAALRAVGYQLFSINPLAVARYRDRHTVSRAKSDPGDALVLANILRTDLTAHRPVPDDSELVQSIPGPGPGPTRRGVGSPADREQAALAAARVLPDAASYLRGPDQL